MADRRNEPHDMALRESEEGLAYQRKSWRVERVGWVLMAAFLVLGMLGLFGGEPLGRPNEDARFYRLDR